MTLGGDDALYVADTPSLGGGGGENGSGSVFRTALPPGLTATGKSGAYSSGGTYQNFVELDDVTTFAEGFDQTYRTFIWDHPE